ncbi:MAG: DNA primase, partial [Planctomycetota bacterium]|nr:DNA primase [Planctomycetota bacterium]
MQTSDFRTFIERVKLRSPIEVVVAERVPQLKKKGSRWWAACPFHDEKTPSFSVDPERGTWHCFGACGEGGDVIAFVERFDGLSFVDSLRLLAQSCGEEMPERTGRRGGSGGGGGDQDELDRLHDVLLRAAKLYARKLRSAEGSAAREYLRGRGFTDEIVEAFGLGWAPARGNPVLEAARLAGFAERVLLETGLIGRGEDGRAYDFFHGRLMIPIGDRLGRTVGFGGRMLPGDEREGGKYVNTSETRLFKKSRLIYGLHEARDAVRRTRHLVLMEGYTDVWAAHQAGLTNTAAVLGTATTDEHAGLVRRTGARRVTVVFDGDEAGRKAARRALAGLLPTGAELDVVPLEQGEDPCDVLVAEGGGEDFRARLDGAREWFAWVVDGLRGLDPRHLAAEVDEVLDLLERLP